ncbi:MAG: PAS domain S-box protein [Ignavibacteria bacterium]|nr:PAS domain S-box protein [Ignavibacteria bacterium]
MFIHGEKDFFEILYAEDDPGSRKLLQQYVKANNLQYNVSTASSYEESLKMIARSKFDLIIADYYLGDGLGIDLIKYLKGIPLIIVTGAGDEEVAINSMKSGAYDYLVKSPQLTHLKKLSFTVESVIRKKYLDNVFNMHSQAIQNTNDAVFFIDTKNNFIYVNEAFKKTYNYKEQEVLGKNFGMIWEEKGKSFDKFYDSKLSGEYYSVKSNGKVIPVLLTYTPIKQENGEIIAGVGIVRDITEQKKSQMVLKKYSEHLEKLVEERTKELRERERFATIGETATMVGHDLRNPLQVLVNSVYIAKVKIENKQIAQEIMNDIFSLFDDMHKQIEYMNKIVSDLQYYGKNIKLNISTIDVELFLNKIIKEHANYPNIRYLVSVEKKMKEVKFDKDLMQRVFINLISNSYASIRDKGTIKIKATKNHQYFNFTVTDDGTGIPEEIRQNLFKPLFTTKAKGTGLGLSVCKRIIDAHQGLIEIESHEGKGTSVKISIPEIN